MECSGPLTAVVCVVSENRSSDSLDQSSKHTVSQTDSHSSAKEASYHVKTEASAALISDHKSCGVFKATVCS